ncbi:hypothetical protein GGF46_004819 [Coemansia sp. RSA 552]|nr:hypothetical protein GGF46_004819 [Coemansia sp. RSA 552]
MDAFVASCGLRVEDDVSKRRRAVARRAFRRGSVVISIPPLFGFPERPGEDSSTEAKAETRAVEPASRCAHCFGPLPPRRPRCSQCHQVLYCSTECLGRHWALRHHFECRYTTSTADRAAEKVKPQFRPYLRMAVGVAAALDNVRKGDPSWMHVQRAAWSELLSHQEQYPPHVLRQYAEIATAIGSADPGGTVTLLCRAGCNNFAAYESGAPRMCGYLCSPLVSLLLNHSCLPNATFVYEDGRQVVRALEDIPEGQEITLAYSDALRPRADRRTQLESVYFFDCKCAKCSDASVRGRIDLLVDREVDSALVPRFLPTDYARLPEVVPWALYVVGLLLSRVQGSVALDAFESGLLGAIDGSEPQDVSFAAYRHWLECQDECLERIATGQTELYPWGYVSSLCVLAFYTLAYPPFYSLVGFQCLEVAKLAWNTLASADQAAGLAVLDVGHIRGLVQAALSILEVSADPGRARPTENAASAREQAALLLDQLDQLDQR